MKSEARQDRQGKARGMAVLARHAARHWLRLLFGSLLLVALPIGCSVLEQKERELVFRIEPGTARWYNGLPDEIEVLHLSGPRFGPDQKLHAWWWPADDGNEAPALLYLHGARWNLTGHLFRIRQLREFGFSVLAIDYRGFGESTGDLPSEATVYEDARVAWERLKALQPDPGKRVIYGHSLGGAVAVDLAARLRDEADRDGGQARPAGLIVESSFTSLGDIATVLTGERWPVRWLLSQKFDSIDKIGQVGVPVLFVHGTKDRYVPARFSEELYAAASEPKQLLLVEDGTHNNSMRSGRASYAKAIRALLEQRGASAPLVTTTSGN